MALEIPGAYSETTHDITVTVDPIFLDEESEPDAGLYFWAYHIVIENNGSETVQLLSRYWRITNALGALQEVRGDGVVGEQPVLEPGQAFEYSSGTPLSTASGFMGGNYQMIARKGSREFEIKIPTFSLDSPYEDRSVN